MLSPLGSGYGLTDYFLAKNFLGGDAKFCPFDSLQAVPCAVPLSDTISSKSPSMNSRKKAGNQATVFVRKQGCCRNTKEPVPPFICEMLASAMCISCDGGVAVQ